MLTYEILDNGGHPYIVNIHVDKKHKINDDSYGVDFENVKVDIYDNGIFEDTGDFDQIHLPPEFLVQLEPKRVFIGKSPKNKMTEFSGGYGPDENGNTILLDMGENIYVFMNRNIEYFCALSKIVT